MTHPYLFLFMYLTQPSIQSVLLWSIWYSVCLVPLYIFGSVSQTRFMSSIISKSSPSTNLNKTWGYIASETVYGMALNIFHQG